MYEIKKELKDQIQKCVLDAYYYGTKDYHKVINFDRGVENFYNVDVEFINHRIEIYVSTDKRSETLTLPYGIDGQSVLLDRIYSVIDILAFKLTNV
jgi:hypothetical protein